MERKVSKVVVEHKDRLTRFNFEIIKKLAKGFGVEIEVVRIRGVDEDNKE